MRLGKVSRTLCVVAFGLSAACSFALSLHAEPPPGKAQELPSLKPLSKETKSLRQARGEVLSSLYDQLQRADSEESAELIASAIEKLWSQSGSDTADLLMERAGLAFKARNYELAEKLLLVLTEIEPRYVAGWSQLATVYFLREDYVQAMHWLRRVLALDPRHFKAIEGLGIILRDSGNKKAALLVTRKALAIHPYLKSAKQAEQELAREIEGQEI